jgi:formate hydrogenlyase subunit 4
MYSAVFLQVAQIVVVPLAFRRYAGGQARVEAIVAPKRGLAIVEPCRDRLQWPRRSSATSDPASWVFPRALCVASACYLIVLAIVLVIRNGLLPLAFLADVVGGALVFAVASLVIASSGVDTSSSLGGLQASRVFWIDRPRRAAVEEEPCSRSAGGRR